MSEPNELNEPGVAPVAVKVEEGAMNRSLMDGFTVDREKVSTVFYL